MNDGSQKSGGEVRRHDVRARVLRTALAVALVAVAGACNSTTRVERGLETGAGTVVPLPERGVAASEDALGGPTSDDGGGPAVTDAAGAATTGSGNRPSRSRGTDAVAASAAGGTTAAAVRRNVPVGRGATATTITIGFVVSADLQAAFGAVGAEGNAPDERSIREALVAAMNRSGGIAGRRILPVYAEVNPTSGTFESQAQRACSTFTEDNEVFAVIGSNVGGSDALLQCLGGRRVPFVELNVWPFDTPYFQRYPDLYQPGRIRADRAFPATVDALADGGFFDPGHRLGLLRFDAPVFTRLTEQQVKPRLAARGANLVAEVVVTTPKSVAEFGGMSAEFNSAILRFRQQRVTHVFLVENASIMPFFFLKQAESSGFRPRYGFNSYDLPQTVAAQSPVDQMRRSLAFGWMPPSDNPYDLQLRGQRAWDRCDRIMKDAGFEPATFYSHNACDGLFFLEHALARADALTADGLRAVTDRLGATYDSPYTYGTRFGAGRRDGGVGGKLQRYDETCECFRPTGGVRRVP